MVTKVALEPVWYLPGVAKRFGCSETQLREAVARVGNGAAQVEQLLDGNDIVRV